MEAYTALLAVQDAVVRHSIKSFLDWAQLGINTVYEATSTAEVTEQLMQKPVDIVILDLQMNIKPDRRFLQSIHLYSPDADCLLIGSEQDFTLFSVCDTAEIFQFLLKPLNLEMLRFSLARCIHFRMEAEEHARSFAVIQDQFQRARTVSIQNLALDLFRGAVSPSRAGIEKRLAEQGVAFLFPIYYCVVGDIVSPHSAAINHNLYFGAIRERIRENFPYVVEGTIVTDTLTAFDGNRIGLIIGCKQENRLQSSRALLHVAFSVLKKTFGLDYILTFSATAKSLAALPPLYRQICNASQYYRFVHQYGVFVEPSDLPAKTSISFVSAKQKQRLRICITDRLPQQIPEVLAQIQAELLEAGMNNMDHLSLAIGNLLTDGVALLEDRGGSADTICGMDCFTKEFFISFQSIEQLFAWICSFFQKIYQAYHTVPNASKSSAVRRVIKYTQEHYAEPITLKGIAEVLHYSANYLGRAFYAEERMRYSDYLHQIRIQYASELLLTSSLTPTLIAEKVGYKDITYFHKMFRQITGTTPRAYRASSKQDESSKNA